MEEANFLTRFASKVTIIHRRDTFRASKIMLERARKNPKISFLPDTVVEDVHDVHKKEVTALQLRNVKTNLVYDFTPPMRCFWGSVTNPTRKFSQASSTMDKDGYLKMFEYVLTRVPGVFACGDCRRPSATGRPSRLRARVAWRRSNRSGFWKSIRSEPKAVSVSTNSEVIYGQNLYSSKRHQEGHPQR